MKKFLEFLANEIVLLILMVGMIVAVAVLGYNYNTLNAENRDLYHKVTEAEQIALDWQIKAEDAQTELDKAKEDLQACSFRFEELDVLLYDYEKQVKTLEKKVAELTPTEEVNPYAAINMTEEEHNMLKWIVALECKGEPDAGRKAVIEEIFNRVLRSDWQDTVEKVLTAKGQFATWQPLKEYWDGDRTTLWAYPDESETELIEYVLTHGRTILPEDYVFFATYKANGKDFVQIGNHYFSRG